MQLNIDETAVSALIAMLTKKVAELECDVIAARDSENAAWRETNEANAKLRQIEYGDSPYSLDWYRTECAKLRDQLDVSQETLRRMGNQNLHHNPECAAVRERYRNGDLKGNKIGAIKALREVVSCGLREAKDYIESAEGWTVDT
jgi:hypothetical protein